MLRRNLVSPSSRYKSKQSKTYGERSRVSSALFTAFCPADFLVGSSLDMKVEARFLFATHRFTFTSLRGVISQKTVIFSCENIRRNKSEIVTEEGIFHCAINFYHCYIMQPSISQSHWGFFAKKILWTTKIFLKLRSTPGGSLIIPRCSVLSPHLSINCLYSASSIKRNHKIYRQYLKMMFLWVL